MCTLEQEPARAGQEGWSTAAPGVLGTHISWGTQSILLLTPLQGTALFAYDVPEVCWQGWAQGRNAE